MTNAVVNHADDKDTKGATNSNNNSGINQGGIVTNTHNLGESEVVQIVDNIYYETLDLNTSDS